MYTSEFLGVFYLEHPRLHVAVTYINISRIIAWLKISYILVNIMRLVGHRFILIPTYYKFSRRKIIIRRQYYIKRKPRVEGIEPSMTSYGGGTGLLLEQ